MSPFLVISIISAYFLLLISISFFTGKNSSSVTFFTANRKSPWYLVAFGMIGASLSGVTFISVPGWVADTQFTYMQIVLGYLVGYFVIGTVLLPLYYRLNLTSIYEYLETRFGFWSYKTGAFYFLLSRIIGASFRLFIVARVLQSSIFDAWDIPFGITVTVTIALIWLYTFRGGIKTIVWTDTLQTLFMLMAVSFVIYTINKELDFSFSEMVSTVSGSEYSTIFDWNWRSNTNFFKQFLSGAFIAIVMTGLDQDMMQKNLTCKTLADAQKNVFWFSVVLVIVNLVFLTLGALLYLYSSAKGLALPDSSDDLFTSLSLNHFDIAAGVLFILGITAAAYSSADSALTALTTSFCVDFLSFKTKNESGEVEQTRTRLLVHVGFSILLIFVILIFKAISNEAIISMVFKAAGYTYGPLLGLYAFGLFTRLSIKDRWVPLVCFLSPLFSYFLNTYSKELFNEYEFGFEILIVNGLMTFLGLLVLRNREEVHSEVSLNGK